jgi:predicted PurR-regulated permease PerM
MTRDVSSRLLFVVLLLVIAWAALQVIAPFLAGLTWAAVLVATFRPFHTRLEGAFRGRRWAATTVVTLIVAGFVIVPVAITGVQAAQGGVAAFEWVQQTYNRDSNRPVLTAEYPWLGDLVERGKTLVGLAHVDLRAAAIAGLQRVAQFVAVQGPALVGGALGMLFSFAVMIVGIPVLFAHGEALATAVAEALPMPTPDAKRILADLRDMTRSLFLSVTLTAAVQAGLAGIAFLLLGVPRALPLTALMFFVALLPGGPALVWAPVAVWLAAIGHTWSAVAMAAWGGGVVGTIDNVLRPVLAGRGVKLGGATLFFGMFGGMIAFGLVGLFLGPITLYLTRELLAILKRDIYTEPAASI